MAVACAHALREIRSPRSIEDRSAGVPVMTILLADDQQEMRAIHADYLRRHGFTVICASDGNEALDRARSSRPDVIVLDHSMPGRRGIDVAFALKADPDTAHIPVLLMTAHAYGAVGRRAREAGCVGFLAKPCGPRRVLEEVRRFVGPVEANA
jgi:two-component system, cell cycle response regulator DivK